jgi:hypothetical protein
MFLAEKAVSFQRGTIPVILTLPHACPLDQSYADELIERNAERRVKREELYLLPLVHHLTEQLGNLKGQPHIIAARVHRSRIDFNRGKQYLAGERAYDDPRAEPFYDTFEQAVAAAVQHVAQYPRGLLLDLHGCFTSEVDVYLGTRNGETAATADGRMFARDDLRDYLTWRGWRVEPGPGQREAAFAGRPDGIIARHNLARYHGRYASLQIEISRGVRFDAWRNRLFAYHLAEAIAELI